MLSFSFFSKLTIKNLIVKLCISFVIVLIALFSLKLFTVGQISGTDFQMTNFSNIISKDNPAVLNFTILSKGLQQIKIHTIIDETSTTPDTVAVVKIAASNGQIILENTFSYDQLVESSMLVIDAGQLNKNASYSLELSSLNKNNGFRIGIGSLGASEITSFQWGGTQEFFTTSVYFCYESINFSSYLVLVLILVAILLLLFTSVKISSDKLSFVFNICLLLFTSVVIVYAVEVLGTGSITNINFLALLFNIAIVLFVILALYFATNNCAVAIGITSFVFAAYGTINYFVLRFRKEVFLPFHIYSATTAANVISEFDLTPAASSVAIYAILVFLTVLAAAMPYKIKSRKFRFSACASTVLSFILTLTFLFSNVASSILGGIDMFYPIFSAQTHGYLVNFAMFIPTMRYVTPKGYNAKELLNAKSNYEDDTLGSIKPNIIVVMAESLADFNDIADLDINADYLPFLHSLANDENAFVGRIAVPAYGGGTCNTEFEALSGFSMANSSLSGAPYSNLTISPTPTIMTNLSQQNYKNTSLHLEIATNWYRNTSYPLMGFDESRFRKDVESLAFVRYWPSDQTHFDNVYGELLQAKPSNPLFSFSITVQNHGGYIYSGDQFTLDEIKFNSAFYPKTEQFFNLSLLTDRVFENFIKDVKNFSQPTIVVFFSDHYPHLDEPSFDPVTDYKNLQLNEFSKIYQTPIVLWSNYGVDFSNTPPLFSANYLQTVISQAISMPQTPFQKFLEECLNVLPVYSSLGFVDLNGNYYKSLVGSDYEELAQQYSYWQHAGLRDYKTTTSLFTLPKQ